MRTKPKDQVSINSWRWRTPEFVAQCLTWRCSHTLKISALYRYRSGIDQLSFVQQCRFSERNRVCAVGFHHGPITRLISSFTWASSHFLFLSSPAGPSGSSETQPRRPVDPRASSSSRVLREGSWPLLTTVSDTCREVRVRSSCPAHLSAGGRRDGGHLRPALSNLLSPNEPLRRRQGLLRSLCPAD